MLRLYNALVLPILLYASESWTLTKSLSLKLDALDTKGLHRLEGLSWQDFVHNDGLCHTIGQPPVISLISQRRLKLSGYLIRQEPTSETVKMSLWDGSKRSSQNMVERQHDGRLT